jgi:3-deoxy-manno-octulosonate cytidylyltransferase (CMP-KDO synthetase)
MNKSPKCYGIIPARYQSSRFLGKPLAIIADRPMIWHVYEQARQCSALSSGTDRVLEAAAKMNLPADAVIINIQGDEPALEPAMLSELVQPFVKPEVQVTTLARKINAREAASPDLVKVVFAPNGTALYFSRSSIPHHRDPRKGEFYGHIGLYAFRMKALKNFVALDQSPLEVTEKLEQLRLLENNIPIHVVLTEYQSMGVDRPEDIEIVEKIILDKKNR